MKKFKTVLTMLVLASLVVFSDSGLAKKGGTPGPPTDPGGGGGGGADLGDLIVLYRDAWGVPFLTDDLCQQPLAAPGKTLPEVILPGGAVIPGCVPPTPADSCIIPVDHTTCAVVVGYEEYTQEVDFGRTSVIRSPDTVLEQSLGEVVTKLTTAQCTTLDPAGRLVNTSKINDLDLSATIDSPLENLAIYRQLMRTGYLVGTDGTHIVLPDDNVLNTAARGLGAANDKTGKVTVDQVVYTNQIMGFTDENVPTYLPKICINFKEEVQGTAKTVRKCFLNYGPEHDYSVGSELKDYQYNRTANFGALPAPPYIPEDEDLPGWFEYLGLWSDLTATVPTLFYIVQGPILDSVFCLDAQGEPVVPVDGDCIDEIAPGFVVDPGFEDGNVGGFTQAADDTRKVIEFTHDRPLPLGYKTAVPLCVPATDLERLDQRGVRFTSAPSVW